MRQTWLSLGSVGLGLLLAGPALAHITITAPVRRHENVALQKTAPCGMGGAGDVRNNARVNTFKAGESITVTWNETVPHPGWYRISFSMDGKTWPSMPMGPMDTAARPNVLVDGIVDKTGTQSYEQKITLPDVACDQCAIRLIQVMTDKQGNGWGNDEFYYQCADLVLTKPMPDLAQEPDLKMPPAMDLSTGSQDLSVEVPKDPGMSGGCSLAGRGQSPGHPFGLAGLLGLGIVVGLRRSTKKRQRNYV